MLSVDSAEPAWMSGVEPAGGMSGVQAAGGSVPEPAGGRGAAADEDARKKSAGC